jgi:hypothetical protein
MSFYNDNYGGQHYDEGQCCHCGKRVNYYVYGEQMVCWRCSEAIKQRQIDAIAKSQVSVDKTIQYHEERLVELAALKEKMEVYGDDFNYGPDDAILFKFKYPNTKTIYTYVAVKVSKNRWFLTGKNPSAITFEALVTEYLIKAEEVWVCTEWKQF